MFFKSAMKWTKGVEAKGTVVSLKGNYTLGLLPSDSVVVVGVASRVHPVLLALARGVPGSL
jgi:hypothetical protein